MDREFALELAEKVLGAWNQQDVEAVVSMAAEEIQRALAHESTAVRLGLLCHADAVPRGGPAFARYCAAASFCAEPFRASFSDSATRNASSSD